VAGVIVAVRILLVGGFAPPSTDRVMAPSSARMPFDASGRLKAGGPGPYPEDFLEAVDLRGLPWTRHPRDAWSSPALRAQVFRWVREFMKARKTLTRWDIAERATVPGSSRMAPDDQFLRFGFTKRVNKSTVRRVEVSSPFPVLDRADPARVQAILARVGVALDQLLA